MGFFGNVVSNIGSAVGGTVRAFDPTSSESFSDRLENVGRGVATAATLGGSEVAREAYRKGSKALSKMDPTRGPKVPELSASEAEKIKAARIKGIAGPKAAQLERVNLDQTLANRSREQQMQALAMQRQAAMGQGPSAAEILARQQANRIAEQQMAAATARGFNPAAQRGAMYQGAQAQQDASQTAALARAQEQMAARNAFGQQASNLRSQDLNQSMAVADMAAQQNALQAQLEQQAGLAGFQQASTNALEQARLNQAAAMANQAAMEGRTLAQFQAQMGANQAAAQGRSALLGGLLNAGGRLGAAWIGG